MVAPLLLDTFQEALARKSTLGRDNGPLGQEVGRYQVADPFLDHVPQPFALELDDVVVQLFTLLLKNELVGAAVQCFVAQLRRVMGVDVLEASL
jgi:hypothetical protein